MVNLKSKKGVTILSTVIIIVILIILTSTIVVTSSSSLENMQLEKFKVQLEMIEDKVSVISEKIKAGNTNYSNYGIELSKLTSTAQSQAEQAIENAGKNTDGFKYYNNQELEKMEITGIENPVLINITTGDVVSFYGYTKDSKTYYTLYSVEHMKNE